MSQPFIAIHFGDQLTIINPSGTVGIVTLWSRVAYVLRLFHEGGIDMAPASSPIAVVGTLYGNGLRELLRNLLYNPQIDTLILFGRDRSGSADELRNFFTQGLEPNPMENVAYETEHNRPAPASVRIHGTARVIDNMVQPHLFERPLRLVSAGNPQEAESLHRIRGFLESYEPDAGPVPERLEIGLPKVRITRYPSNPRQHVVCASDPLTAWRQLIHRLHRFGIPVNLAKGARRELQGVKVVVESPREVPAELLQKYGFSQTQLKRYQQDILSGVLSADETYSYGHRLKSYFGVDGLEKAVQRLRKDPEDRKSYVVLWDPRRDLTSTTGHPCMVSLFFRRFQEALTLTAVFRTHNGLDAWLVNFYGLMAIQSHVSEGCGMNAGAITVFSHSLTIDTRQMDRATLIANEWDLRYTEDPMGYFRITLDGNTILAEHRSGDTTLNTYRHPKASHIQYDIYRDCAVSDINHAIYLGRQLARAEICLREGRAFTQE
jgi:thymidylate synthase